MCAWGQNIYPQKSTFEPLKRGDIMRKIRNEIYKKKWMKMVRDVTFNGCGI
tara:strand:+ start:187 stop:339 length:153 start_codon:yes stop_codon:yes gene_type:complete